MLKYPDYPAYNSIYKNVGLDSCKYFIKSIIVKLKISKLT